MSEFSETVGLKDSGASAIPLFLNEKAGALHGHAAPEQLLELVESAGIELDVITTDSVQDLQEHLREMVARGVPQVAVAGGDGTIHAAAQILANTDTALGIIPQGTANNFATALRLPQDLPSALRILGEGQVMSVDLGRVGNEYFTEAAGVGLFADALALYGKSNKNILKAFKAILKIVFSMRASRIRLTIDGEAVQERAVLCTVANTFRMAYAMPVAPGAKITDHKLDIVVFGDLSRSELIPYFKAMRAQLHTTLPKVHLMQGEHVKIEAYRRMLVHCDDRVITTTPTEIDVAPDALKVLVERL